MANEEIISPGDARAFSRGPFQSRRPKGPVIDQEGREVWQSSSRGSFRQFQFDFAQSSANPFGNLTHEQRLVRFETLAKLLDIAFILPGTNLRYGVDGIIRLVPVVGDVLATAFSLWLVREARALGAPWHVTARMLGNVAVDGVVGMVPLAGDAFDVLFRANMRNVRLLRRWLEKQPR
jgi:Domain of unknown function (DUF4112)